VFRFEELVIETNVDVIVLAGVVVDQNYKIFILNEGIKFNVGTSNKNEKFFKI